MTTIEIYHDSLPAADLLHLPAEHARIDLDRRHVAIRAEHNWWLYQRRPDGWLTQIDHWVGPRRSIFNRLEDLGIEPSEAAEAQLDGLTEGANFRVDEPEKSDDAIDSSSNPVDKSEPQGVTTE